LEKAKEIIVNAKTQRPGVCNAIETVLIHRDRIEDFLPSITKALKEKNVELRVDKDAIKFVENAVEAIEEDWDTEYLDLIISIKTVDSLDEAIDHINKHSTKHSDAILTENFEKSK
jgi:Gamma-glutamyl phosphate reductase